MKKKMVVVQVDLPNEMLLELCLMAHESDMTLNAFVNKILMEYIVRMEKERKISKKQMEHGIIK